MARTMADLMQFVHDNKLDQEEYFTAGWKPVDGVPLWREDTRWIAVYWVEGSNEGYYVHVDRLNWNKERQVMEVEHMATGKFWQKWTATRAVAMLTPWVHGIEKYGVQPVVSPTWKEEQVNDWFNENLYGGMDNSRFRACALKFAEALREEPPFRAGSYPPSWSEEWVGG